MGMPHTFWGCSFFHPCMAWDESDESVEEGNKPAKQQAVDTGEERGDGENVEPEAHELPPNPKLKPKLMRQRSFIPSDCENGPILCEMASMHAAAAGIKKGCFNMHSNVTGRHAWCCSEACFDQYLQKQIQLLSKYSYWTEIDISNVDPTFACRYGGRCGIKNSAGTVCDADFGDLVEKLSAAKDEISSMYTTARIKERKKGNMYPANSGFRSAVLNSFVDTAVSDARACTKDSEDAADQLHPKQYNSALKVYSGALEFRPLFDTLVDTALTACGLPDAESFISIKKGFRASEKVRTKYAPALGVAEMWRGLTDVLRGFVVCKTMTQMEEILLFCYEQPYAKLLRIKNRFDTPSASGYSDILCNIRLTKTGTASGLSTSYVVELQLHLSAIKHMDCGHQTYKWMRKLATLGDGTDTVLKGDCSGSGRGSGSGSRTTQGKMRFANGSVYEGEWRDGKPHGEGKIVFINGDVYAGGFAEGKQHGTGKLSWSDARTYEGQFANDHRHGEGFYTFGPDDPAYYRGGYVKDKKEGHGTYMHSDGAVYEGAFFANKKHGEGKQTYANGDIYEGQWQKGKQHGVGKMTRANGYAFDGEWEMGKSKKAHAE